MRVLIFSFLFVFAYSNFLAQESNQSSEALLILPGFGSKIYGTKKLKRYFRDASMPVFIAPYISRKSIDGCVSNLNQYIFKKELASYTKLHVLAFIVGSWTLKSYLTKITSLQNLRTIIYDRSPLQERAPWVLINDMKLVNGLLFGPITHDLVRTPYPVLNFTGIRRGIIIETMATRVIRNHKNTALSLGPISWSPDSLKQPYDDYTYLPLNHDEMYKHPEAYGQEIFYFIRNGVFSDSMKQNRPVMDPFVKKIKK